MSFSETIDPSTTSPLWLLPQQFENLQKYSTYTCGATSNSVSWFYLIGWEVKWLFGSQYVLEPPAKKIVCLSVSSSQNGVCVCVCVCMWWHADIFNCPDRDCRPPTVWETRQPQVGEVSCTHMLADRHNSTDSLLIQLWIIIFRKANLVSTMSIFLKAVDEMCQCC